MQKIEEFDNVYCNNITMFSSILSRSTSCTRTLESLLRQHGDNECTIHSLKHDVVNKVRKTQ